MLYASLTFWLLVIVFSAWGIHSLWSLLVKPRVVNSVLLPGTLVAQLGHVLGLLITGNSVRNTMLMSDDEEGDPQTDPPEKTKIPVVGPILVGLLPLVACGACLYLAAHYWGGNVLGHLAGDFRVPELPRSIAGIWDLLRGSVTLIEQMLNAIVSSDLMNWSTALFLYLAICLTVRMAPFDGHRRGAIGAILLAGVLIALVSSLSGQTDRLVASSWPILSFSVAMLLFLLLVSLLISGLVGLIRILATEE